MLELIKQIKSASEVLAKEYDIKYIDITISEKLSGEKEVSVSVEV